MIWALIFYACFTPLAILAIPRIAEAIDVRTEEGWQLQGYLVPAMLEVNPTDWDDLEGLV